MNRRRKAGVKTALTRNDASLFKKIEDCAESEVEGVTDIEYRR